MAGVPPSDQIARANGKIVPKKPHPRLGKPSPCPFKPGNKHAVKHGVYATAFVRPEEKERFQSLRQEIAREFKRECGPDTLMLDIAALLAIRHGTALCAGEMKLANETLPGMLSVMDKLKATKSSREAGQATGPETTPGEWMSDLVGAAKARKVGEPEPLKPTEQAEEPNESPKNTENTSHNVGMESQNML